MQGGSNLNYIFYQTKTKFSNTGDALINKSLIEVLRNYGKLKCNCSKDISDAFIIELGIKDSEKLICNSQVAFSFAILKKAIKVFFKKDKVFLFSGLGHIYSTNCDYSKIKKNILASFMFLIYRIFGIRIVRIGFTIGPISRRLAISEFIRSIFVSDYYVRDIKSLQLCRKIGIKKAKLCPDLSWMYIANTNRALNNKKIIAINLKSSVLSEKNDEYIRSIVSRCEQILLLIQEYYSNHFTVRFMYQVADDKDFCIRLYNHFKDVYCCEYIDKQMMLSDAQDYFKDVDINISNRMHSLLLGYKYGSLPLALIDINNHVKIAQTFKDSSIDKLLVNVYNTSSEEIIYILKHRKREFNNLISMEKYNQKEIKKNLDEIFLKHNKI